MIDRETARQGTELLSTLIGVLMEDTAPEAVRTGRGGPKHGMLLEVGRDVIALATAMEVIARRSRPLR